MSYEGLYFKKYYPVYFFVALLTSVMDKTDKTTGYIADCKKTGILVLPPDVNESDVGYSVTEDKKNIRIGLNAIKKVGEGISEGIVAERERNGKFKSINDFKKRMEGKANKGVIEALIKVGAFDSFGINRNRLLGILDEIADFKKESKNEQILQDQYGGGLFALIGQTDFGYVDQNEIKNIPEAESPTSEEISRYEKELLGIYITKHPLDNIKEKLYDNVTATGDIIEAMEVRDGSKIIIGGVIEAKVDKPTRSGTMMSQIVLDDGSGAFINIVVFSKKYDSFKTFKVDDIVLIKGRANHRTKFGTEDEMEIQIMGDDIMIFDPENPMTNKFASNMNRNQYGGYYMLPTYEEPQDNMDATNYCEDYIEPNDEMYDNQPYYAEASDMDVPIEPIHQKFEVGQEVILNSNDVMLLKGFKRRVLPLLYVK